MAKITTSPNAGIVSKGHDEILQTLPFFLTFGIWFLLRNARLSRPLGLALIPFALVTIAVGVPSIWQAASEGYENDSYWTLQTGGRLGVALISTLGLTGFFLFLSLKSKWMGRLPILARLPLDVAIGCGLYSVAYTVSPQIFYTFYQFIFPGLPNQIVIDQVLDFEKMWQVARFAAAPSLSDHLAGVAFWAIAPFTVWIQLIPPAPASADRQ